MNNYYIITANDFIVLQNEDVDMDSDSESNSGSGDDFNDEFQWFRQCYDAGSESFEWYIS